VFNISYIGKHVFNNKKFVFKYYRKILYNMEKLVNFIVSLTTSPKRLPLLGETIDSILSQNVAPKKIYVNIPPIFKRTNEPYPDPEVLFADKPNYKDIVVWNNNCEDVGPITKLQGTLTNIDENENVWIITIDDDIKYLQYTLELYLMCALRISESKTFAFGFSGFNWHNGVNIIAQYENACAHVLEGYGSVCYHRSQFPNKSWNSYLNKCLENRDCKFSDDVIISNWLSLKSITKFVVSTPMVSRKLMWANKCVLDHGNEADALHNGGSSNTVEDTNVVRYKKVKEHLNSIKLLCGEFKATL